jgi:hypothetical protein
MAEITLDTGRWGLIHLDRDPRPCLRRFEGIEGAGYDWCVALFSALRFGPVNNPDAWFCSEACTYAITSDRDMSSPGELAVALRSPR